MAAVLRHPARPSAPGETSDRWRKPEPPALIRHRQCDHLTVAEFACSHSASRCTAQTPRSRRCGDAKYRRCRSRPRWDPYSPERPTGAPAIVCASGRFRMDERVGGQGAAPPCVPPVRRGAWPVKPSDRETVDDQVDGEVEAIVALLRWLGGRSAWCGGRCRQLRESASISSRLRPSCCRLIVLVRRMLPRGSRR